jgi:vacuolar protein sorting-associated protein 35
MPPKQVPTAPVDPEEEQERWLSNATSVVRQEGFSMKRSLDQGQISEALFHASNMLNEMRTSLLSPKNYYDLYMHIFSELSHLRAYFSDEARRGTKLAPLYEIVQHCGNVVPRLYLLITVGSVCISSGQAPAPTVLRDLTEMCRAVQHPTRGLFLRYYLAQTCKELLPSGLDDSLTFILQNFVEANRLWVRIKYLMRRHPNRQQEERMQLRMCVGTFLVLLSQLETLTVEAYAEKVLPQLCEQVVACRDVLAQQYLMEAITQVFPDDFHLATLPSFLVTCRKLVRGVDLRTVFMALMARLTAYAQGIAGRKDVFTAFYEELQYFVALMDPEVRKMAVHHVDSFEKHDEKQRQQQDAKDAKAKGTPKENEKQATDSVVDAPNEEDDEHAELKEEKLERKLREDEEEDPLKIKEHVPVAALHSAEYATAIIQPLDILSCEEALFALVRVVDSSDLAAVDAIFDQASRALSLILSPLLSAPAGQIPNWGNYSPTAMRGRTLASIRADEKYRKKILALLHLPLDRFDRFLPVLSLRVWPTLGIFLTVTQRKRFASDVARRALAMQEPLSNMEHLEAFFMLLETLLTDTVDDVVDNEDDGDMAADSRSDADLTPAMDQEDEEDFAEEQNLVARCVHLIRGADSPDAEFRLLSAIRRVFGKGGTRRLVYTLPAVIFAYLRLAPRVAAMPDGTGAPVLQKLYKQVLEALDVFAPHRPQQTLRMHLEASVVADRTQCVDFSYEYLSKAYLLFEEQIVDSRAQVAVLTIFTNTLCSLRNMPDDTYDALAARVSLYGLKLLKRIDQCRCIYNASHMFGKHAPQRVLECLQKSIRIADSAMIAEQVTLLVEILEKYVYHYAAGVEKVTAKYIVSLVDLIAENMKKVDAEAERELGVPPVQVAYDNTLKFLRRQYADLLTAPAE